MMDRTRDQWNITEGTDVVGSDGDKVGEVVAIHQDYIVVEKGFFFPTDYYIPMSAISSFDDDKLYLSVTKDAALDQGWDAAPADTGYTTTTDTAGYTADMGATDVTMRDTETAAGGVDERGHRTTGSISHTDEGDSLRVPVHEEELTATKRERKMGEVRIDKDVVAEERTMEVPVTEERVRVERRVTDRDAAPGEAAFEEGSIEVPIRGEEVDVQKRTRVAEELEVSKEAVQHDERVGGTVRREEVYVDETGTTQADRGTRNP